MENSRISIRCKLATRVESMKKEKLFQMFRWCRCLSSVNKMCKNIFLCSFCRTACVCARAKRTNADGNWLFFEYDCVYTGHTILSNVFLFVSFSPILKYKIQEKMTNQTRIFLLRHRITNDGTSMTLTLINFRRSYSLLGYVSNDLLGKNFIDFIHEDDRSKLNEIWIRGKSKKEERKNENLLFFLFLKFAVIDK